jgi:leucyl aminopeptidase
MNYYFVSNTLKNIKLDGCHVIIYSDLSKLTTIFSKKGLTSDDIGSKLSMHNGKYIYFYFDTNSVYSSIKDIAHSIDDACEDVCIDISSLGVEYKHILCQYISKYSYDPMKNTIDIYFKDKLKYKGMIMDIINEIKCTNITRDIENITTNKLFPDKLSSRIKALFNKQKNTEVIIYSEKQMKQYGLNIILEVALSSHKAPRFVVIEYIKDRRLPNICLLGKIVCFDTNDLSPRNKNNIQNKTDKSGGAIICGIIKYFEKYGNHIDSNIIGIIPIVENLVNCDETNNIQCKDHNIIIDALHFSEKYNPRCILDFETLSSSSQYSLTEHNTIANISSTNESLLNMTKNIGELVGERVHILESNKDKLEFVPIKLKNKFIYFDLTNNRNEHGFTGNGVSLGINIIKKLTRKRRR